MAEITFRTFAETQEKFEALTSEQINEIRTTINTIDDDEWTGDKLEYVKEMFDNTSNVDNFSEYSTNLSVPHKFELSEKFLGMKDNYPNSKMMELNIFDEETDNKFKTINFPKEFVVFSELYYNMMEDLGDDGDNELVPFTIAKNCMTHIDEIENLLFGKYGICHNHFTNPDAYKLSHKNLNIVDEWDRFLLRPYLCESGIPVICDGILFCNKINLQPALELFKKALAEVFCSNNNMTSSTNERSVNISKLLHLSEKSINELNEKKANDSNNNAGEIDVDNDDDDDENSSSSSD